MNRASPIDLRKAADTAGVYVKAGLLFVPMPVLSEADHTDLLRQAHTRLGQLIEAAKEVGHD